jgi:hypothetical protein
VGNDPSVGGRAKITIGVFFLALAVVFALGAASGAAAKKKHKRPPKLVGTQITLDAVGPDGAIGHVSSRRAECVSDRVVTLYMEGTESSVRTSDAVANTKTHGDGSWTAAQYAGHTLYTGEYYAVVSQQRVGRVICDDATSNEKSW